MSFSRVGCGYSDKQQLAGRGSSLPVAVPGSTMGTVVHWSRGVKSHQVKRFAILDESTSEGFLGLETMILVKGTEDYAAIFKRAFPGLAFDGPYPNDTADFDGFLICHATD